MIISMLKSMEISVPSSRSDGIIVLWSGSLARTSFKQRSIPFRSVKIYCLMKVGNRVLLGNYMEYERPKHEERKVVRKMIGLHPVGLHDNRNKAAERIRASAALSCFNMIMSPEYVFDVTTIAIMPLYAMIIGAPHKRLTRQVMASPLPLLGAAIAYTVLAFSWDTFPHLLETFKEASQRIGMIPDVTMFAEVFKKTAITSLSWLHLVTLDFLQAR